MKMANTIKVPLLLSAVLFACVTESSRLYDIDTVDGYLNICLDGISHKSTPGPEDDLHKMCKPWKERSCCTQNVSLQLHLSPAWYNHDWSHCPQKLSKNCRARFLMDLCFYECSPNVGPWLHKVSGMKIRKEKFVDVPLCQHECDAWWDDCMNEYTCTENWARGFNWSTGTNKCPVNSECRTFKEVWKNSSNFCEKVWDHSWKVVPDDAPGGCMLTWFPAHMANPNNKVARAKAQGLVSSSTRTSPLFSLLSVIWALLKILSYSAPDQLTS